MKLNHLLFLLGIVFWSCQGTETYDSKRLQIKTFTTSKFIAEKTYRVYLPKSYSENTEKNYPVLYMMDGQNLFSDKLSYSKVAWNIHETVDSLSKAETIKEVIVVGIDHEGVDRFSEYMPQKPMSKVSQDAKDSLITFFKKPVYSDDFLSFLIKEFKPFIDANYRTKLTVEDTFIGGSSMGGLISMYAQCEYPQIFGGALCFSTHWPIGMNDDTPEFPTQLIDYFSKNIPQDKKWYFDFGTEGLDKIYEPYQNQIDSILQQNNYVADKNWMTRKYVGHSHNEKYWNERMHIPLKFILGKKQ